MKSIIPKSILVLLAVLNGTYANTKQEANENLIDYNEGATVAFNKSNNPTLDTTFFQSGCTSASKTLALDPLPYAMNPIFFETISLSFCKWYSKVDSSPKKIDPVYILPICPDAISDGNIALDTKSK